MAMTEVFVSSKQYTDEFRTEAVNQVIDRGFTVVDVAKPYRDSQVHVVRLGVGGQEDSTGPQRIRRLKAELRLSLIHI